MPDPASIALKTLTPIWTGDAEQATKSVRASGLLGSLRWWFELLLRGVGSDACDPSTHSCRYERDRANDSDRPFGLCAACRVFGATGWARRFRLIIDDQSQPSPRPGRDVTLQGPGFTHTVVKRGKEEQKDPTWYFTKERSGRQTRQNGALGLRVVPTDTAFDPAVIGGLIQFIADWGALGARPQLGFGVVAALARQSRTPLLNYLRDQSRPLGPQQQAAIGPSLQDMFFARVHPAGGHSFMVEDTFILKHHLRRLFAGDRALRHALMGEVDNDHRVRSKVMMSLPYTDERDDRDSAIRVWGYVPRHLVLGPRTDPHHPVHIIHNYLAQAYDRDSLFWTDCAATGTAEAPDVQAATGALAEILALRRQRL